MILMDYLAARVQLSLRLVLPIVFGLALIVVFLVRSPSIHSAVNRSPASRA